jgi:hypothetical protein
MGANVAHVRDWVEEKVKWGWTIYVHDMHGGEKYT